MGGVVLGGDKRGGGLLIRGGGVEEGDVIEKFGDSVRDKGGGIKEEYIR